jgi:aromatic ring-opening dioxygenase catalytic subunit (LigB family)
MSQIVAAIAMSHDPLIPAMPEAAPPEQRERVAAVHAEIRRRLTAARPDVLIVVAPEHFITFSPALVPAFTMGVAEVYTGPIEGMLNLSPFRWRGAPAFGAALATALVQRGFDLALAQELTLDHGVVQPLHYVMPEGQAPAIVPLIVNCIQPPLVSYRRAWQLGEALGEAIRTHGGHERVALIGTGGLSHWVGLPEMGRVNEAWDREVLDRIAAGRGRELAEVTPEWVAQAGNGAEEIRNWLVVLGAMGGRAGSVLEYVPAPAWITGLGYVDLGSDAA